MAILSPIVKTSQNLGIFVWDISLTLLSLITPSRKEGHVIPEGHPGFGGQWPEFISPKEGDSRCSCPALNAMANHGILPRDGRNISFKELNRLVRDTYNFAPTFCLFVPKYAADMLKKNYKTDTFDLSELDLHNGIEHDASLTREDVYFQKDQGVPHVELINELLTCATGKDKDGNPLLTVPDLARISAKRRAAAKVANPEFTLEKIHKGFGSSNSSTMLTIFGGRVRDLETVLLEERLPDGWESRIRKPQGLTMITFNRTVFKVERGTTAEGKKLAVPAAEPETSSPVDQKQDTPHDA